jgi:hypothetical protein
MTPYHSGEYARAIASHSPVAQTLISWNEKLFPVK